MKLNDRNTLTRLARVLLVAAAAVAAYLGYASVSSSAIAGCGDGSSCGDLLASRWSTALGVPVAFFGLGAYLALAALAGPVSRRASDPRGLLGVVLMIAIPAIAAWFVILQFAVIGQVCVWCCATHLLAVLGVGALWLARSNWEEASRGKVAPGRISPALAGGLTVLAVGVFVAANGVRTKGEPGVVEEQLLTGIDRTAAPARDRSPEPAAVAEVPRGEALGMHRGKVMVWPEELPALGNPAADHLAVLLADFTCEHCRSLHAMLDEVTKVYGDQLGIVVLPATRGEESKVIQRIALALHRESPSLYRALSAAIGSGEVAANSSEVVAEATRLMGSERLASAVERHGDWIEAQIASTEALRALNKKQSGRSTLPQLMLQDEVVFGAHPSPGYYVDLLQSRFGVRQVAVVDTVVGTGSSESRPQLAFKSRKIPIGEVKAGETVNVSVPYENAGEGPLVFRWINTPPGVGVVDLPSGEIAPGAKGELTLQVRVPDESGRIERKLVVHSNDELAGTTLDIVAFVTPDPLAASSATSPWDG